MSEDQRDGADEVVEEAVEGFTVAVPTQMQLLSTWEVRKVPHNCVTRYGERSSMIPLWEALNRMYISQAVYADCDEASGPAEPRAQPTLPCAGCFDEDTTSFPSFQRDTSSHQWSPGHTTAADLLSSGT